MIVFVERQSMDDDLLSHDSHEKSEWGNMATHVALLHHTKILSCWAARSIWL